ncbi:N-acetylglucosamine-6-phosphate deacetylase [Marisediminicola sp. LYQ134]|uniref:N-acetylglucosamine-6-phosphate deacetylase n=1 Tax=unclassified Marisediminicola TaxID=2618316 RepID=UPI0039830B70
MTNPVILAADRLVDGTGRDGTGRDAAGWLAIDEGRIVEVGVGEPPRRADTHVSTVIPGLIDTHVHGAMGVDFARVGTDPAPAIDFHARSGSTSIVASLATAVWNETLDRLRELAPLVSGSSVTALDPAARPLAGLHLEGPFLSHARCGAHDPRLLLEPTLARVDEALDAAGGTLTMVTLAPEIPGAMAAISRLVEAGVTVAIGHTDARADTVRQAVDLGATVVTHLFNGMAPLHHREPGPVGVALTTPSLVVELIADGHHVDDTAIDLVRRAAPDRVVLISDAMAATGLGDGHYDLAGSAVTVTDGVAMLADGSSLAGSTAPVGLAVRRLLDRGVPLSDVVAATSTTPARSLGLPPPALVTGARADLVALDENTVARVMRAGSWLA